MGSETQENCCPITRTLYRKANRTDVRGRKRPSALPQTDRQGVARPPSVEYRADSNS